MYIKFFTSVLLVSFGLTMFIPLSYAQTATTSVDGSSESETSRQQYIRGWRGGSSELQQKINLLDSTPTASVSIPVLFGVELSNLRSDFGDPRSNGRTHIGNDLMALKGTPIVSPTNAVVLRTGSGSGEGNYVYTANPGGETFVYMHLDRFGEGVVAGKVLERGSLIGYVGNTGNASGGAPHLHFEIHDSNGTAMNPFPRITSTFSLQEKIQYLVAILNISSDQNALAQLLVLNFRSTFNNAIAANISLPSIITSYMASLPVTSPSFGSSQSLPSGDLALGSKGADVIKLQQYLIGKNVGLQATRLSQAGATGNFGVMTQSALMEFQVSMGITPDDGYYGATTRAKVEQYPVTTTSPVSVIPTTPTLGGSTNLYRNLSLGATGEDVRMLQKFLNTHGYAVASTGAGSSGNETVYFGPATQAAVIRFQVAQSIVPAIGYVGPITRAKLASSGI